MTDADPALRRRGPFGLVLAAQRIACSPIRPTGWMGGQLPLILGPGAWLSFDSERSRWRIRRPSGSMLSTASAVRATLEVARLEGPTGADLAVGAWLRVLTWLQREVSGG